MRQPLALLEARVELVRTARLEHQAQEAWEVLAVWVAVLFV
jgi:hypothetical protein